MKKIIIGMITLIVSLYSIAGWTQQDNYHDVNGNVVGFNPPHGKLLILNYWASWCPPCRIEIPELNAFYEKTRNSGIIVWGINYDSSSEEETRDVVKQFGIKYPVLTEDPGRRYGINGVKALPVTYIINADGQILKKLYGMQTSRSLEKAIMDSGYRG
jgi:thiol-disulfide isomerase/thioredoxin